MGTTILERPRIFTKEEKEASPALPWNVILYNDDHHTIQEVVLQVQKAIGVSMEAAFEITMDVHKKGHAVCYSGARVDCEKIATVLREIALTVEVVQSEV